MDPRENGRKALMQIKGFLGQAKGGLVAGAFQHAGGNADLDGKEWARVLRVRDTLGEPMTVAQRDLWRAALGLKEGK